MTHESVEKSYKKILSDYKLIQVDTPRQFNSLGQTWARKRLYLDLLF